MAIIVDPDSLSQGTVTAVSDIVFGTPTGNQVDLTSAGANLPALADNEFFEIRDHSDSQNNGLYQVDDASPTTSAVTADKVSGANPIANAVGEAVSLLGTTGAGSELSVHFDTGSKHIYVIEQGNVTSDGVDLQTIYSFFKEERKSDADLIKHQVSMVAIDFDAGKYELGTDGVNFNGWRFEDNASFAIRTRKLIRSAGWSELDSSGNLIKQYSGIFTIGTFEDVAADTAYYFFGTDPLVDDTVNYDFPGPVNEAILVFDEIGNPPTCTFATSSTITRASGSFITDGYKVGGSVTIRAAGHASRIGTFVLTSVAALTLTVTGTPFTTGADATAQLAVDGRSSFNTKIRVRDADPLGKVFDESDLAAAGETVLSNRLFKFGLSNEADPKIAETDANIAANSPYTEIVMKFFDGVYSKDIDSATNRDFGAVIDVGTHSGIDGSFSAAGTVLTSADGGIPTSGLGTLTLHEGTDEATQFTVASSTATTITISGGSFTGTESNISFTAQRSTPVVATLQEIYEKVQYLLRQTTDIDDQTSVVIGRSTDELLKFVGDELKTQQFSNPNTGTEDGIAVEGFDANDTNDLTQTDNLGTERNFPFVSAFTLNFNPNLVNDTDPEFWMFFQYTTRTIVTDLAVSAASGSDASIDSAGANLPAVSLGDYLNLNGFTNAENNGVWVVTDASPTTSQFDATKHDRQTVVNEGAASRNVDANPYNSDDAIVVNDADGNPLQGAISGATLAEDFAYTTNVQGGRTASTDALIVIRAGGLETAQFTPDVLGTITQATGLTFDVSSALERNYLNP